MIRLLKDNDYYCTPPNIWKPLLQFLQIPAFHLDPCSPVHREPFNFPADAYYTEQDNGLLHPWGDDPSQHILLNPPYSQYDLWITKALQESAKGVNIWALLNQSNANFWHDVINPHMRFKIHLRSRVKFIINGSVNENPRYDNVLVFFGSSDSYKNYLKSDPGAFPLKGELIYDVRRLGRY